jgi:hypothetical protein
MGIVASLAASKVAQEVVEDEARRELVRILNIKTLNNKLLIYKIVAITLIFPK